MSYFINNVACPTVDTAVKFVINKFSHRLEGGKKTYPDSIIGMMIRLKVFFNLLMQINFREELHGKTVVEKLSHKLWFHSRRSEIHFVFWTLSGCARSQLVERRPNIN